MAGLHRAKVSDIIFNDIVVKPARYFWKKVAGKSSSNDRFSVDENLPIALYPSIQPLNIPKILEEDDEVQDLEDLNSELFQDADMKDTVIFKSTKLFDKGEGHWVAEPHVRVWSNRPCTTF